MSKVKDTLAILGVKPSKQKGQNFLQNMHTAETLVKGAKVSTEDTVIEIGPGLGALTELLLQASKNLICIEVEKSFIHFLNKKYKDQLDRISFMNDDFREVDIGKLDHGNKVKVVSNLPYVFSSEAIFWLVQNIQFVERASLLVQKEFAERIASEPNSKSFGSISVHAQFYFDISLGLEIDGDAFFPSTEVTSTQLHLVPKRERPKLDSNFDFFESMVRAAFSMRRKKLSNCLDRHFPESSREEIESFLEECGIPILARAENLSVEDFCKLSDKFWNSKI